MPLSGLRFFFPHFSHIFALTTYISNRSRPTIHLWHDSLTAFICSLSTAHPLLYGFGAFRLSRTQHVTIALPQRRYPATPRAAFSLCFRVKSWCGGPVACAPMFDPIALHINARLLVRLSSRHLGSCGAHCGPCTSRSYPPFKYQRLPLRSSEVSRHSAA